MIREKNFRKKSVSFCANGQLSQKKNKYVIWNYFTCFVYNDG